MIGDDHLIAGLHSSQKAAEVSFRFVYVGNDHLFSLILHQGQLELTIVRVGVFGIPKGVT